MRLPLAKEVVEQELITINNHEEEASREVPLVGVSLHVHVYDTYDMQERIHVYY